MSTITIDFTPLFTGINTWTAALFPIFAVGGGIAIAVGLITMIIATIVKSFRGAGGSK